MKKIISITAIMLVLAIVARGQISLENTYTLTNTPQKSGLSIIRLDVSGDKYFLYNIDAKQIKLYNLNHSLFKTINIPALPKYRPNNTDSIVSISYISENLFNTDNLIEYVSFDGGYHLDISPLSYGSMRVFNENGVVIFNGDSLMPTFKRDATYYGYESESKHDFIYNTTAGTKMILYSYKNNVDQQRVYSLPGQLTTRISTPNKDVHTTLPYPNPTKNSIVLPYKLDNGKEGKLVITDLNGKILVEYTIDNTFDNVLIDTNTMTAGSYFYSIYASDKKVSTGKFIVTK